MHTLQSANFNGSSLHTISLKKKCFKYLYTQESCAPSCLAAHICVAIVTVALIDGIQNYVIVIATLFRHFEWGEYQKLPLLYVEIQ